mmetsp:Transcript_62349/g.203374  ORF Transcript_62349/g.203374 Transcript_62349/m.203374 type:complete len:779 (+) Transcript_62349:85-2421(+)
MMQVPQVANESAKLRQELHELLDKYGTSDRGDLEGTEQTASVAGSVAHVAGSAVIAGSRSDIRRGPASSVAASEWGPARVARSAAAGSLGRVAATAPGRHGTPDRGGRGGGAPDLDLLAEMRRKYGMNEEGASQPPPRPALSAAAAAAVEAAIAARPQPAGSTAMHAQSESPPDARAQGVGTRGYSTGLAGLEAPPGPSASAGSADDATEWQSQADLRSAAIGRIAGESRQRSSGTHDAESLDERLGPGRSPLERSPGGGRLERSPVGGRDDEEEEEEEEVGNSRERLLRDLRRMRRPLHSEVGSEFDSSPSPERRRRAVLQRRLASEGADSSEVDARDHQARLWAAEQELEQLLRDNEGLRSTKQASDARRRLAALTGRAGQPGMGPGQARMDELRDRAERLLASEKEDEHREARLRSRVDVARAELRREAEDLEVSQRQSLERWHVLDEETRALEQAWATDEADAGRTQEQVQEVVHILRRTLPADAASGATPGVGEAAALLAAARARSTALRSAERAAVAETERWEAQGAAARTEMRSVQEDLQRQRPILERAKAMAHADEARAQRLGHEMQTLAAWLRVAGGASAAEIAGEREPRQVEGLGNFKVQPLREWLRSQGLEVPGGDGASAPDSETYGVAAAMPGASHGGPPSRGGIAHPSGVGAALGRPRLRPWQIALEQVDRGSVPVLSLVASAVPAASSVAPSLAASWAKGTPAAVASERLGALSEEQEEHAERDLDVSLEAKLRLLEEDRLRLWGLRERFAVAVADGGSRGGAR